MKTLPVELGDRSYPIYIGRDLLNRGGLLGQHLRGHQALIVSNTTVAPLYIDAVRSMLDRDVRVSEVLLPDGEAHKNLRVLEMIFNVALAEGHNRSTTVIALGGGVVGDMAGFAAASYQRGVDYIQIPTTLLAQVDSSVGGKTAVNHPLGKNMIGAFYQPRAVLIDTDVLRSLPDREFAAGLAEVIKYGLIGDAEFFHWLLAHRDDLVDRRSDVLAEAIERSCAAKARIVAADEREGGVRAILNLGHTFGHAIEAAQGYGTWLHGEAVAAGMVLAVRLSIERGGLAPEIDGQLCTWLAGVGLPIAPPADMSAEVWLDHMGRDKKVIDGRLRLVLLADLGNAQVVDDVTTPELEAFIAPYSAA